MNAEQSKLLTQTDSGTPLGDLMRRYWLPVALSAQVRDPDSPPLTTWLLGQRLVVFRDSAGRVGVLDDACMHRGVSLGLGRNEAGGLRCIYHGWKFDVEGRILETPNHPVCAYRERKRANAYPVVESAGLIWTYLGPRDREPPFRRYEFDAVPDSNRHAIRANTETNFLALWEGGVDSSHVGMLHTNNVRPSWAAGMRGESVPPSPWDSLSPTYEVEATRYGFRYAAFREIPGQAGLRHVRQTVVMMPCMRIIPGGDFSIFIIDVPMTATSTATYQIAYSETKKIDPEWALDFLGFNNSLYDRETCWVNMHWPQQMRQDRVAMRVDSWSGYPGIEMEDVAMSLSLRDVDRSRENLVAADVAVVRLRQTMQKAIERFQQSGEALGSDISDLTGIAAYDRRLREHEDWRAYGDGQTASARE